MLKEWQFNVLFFVGVGGAVVLLFGEKVGINIGDNPGAVSGVGAILAYILTQRKALTKPPETPPPNKKPELEVKEEDDGLG